MCLLWEKDIINKILQSQETQHIFLYNICTMLDLRRRRGADVV